MDVYAVAGVPAEIQAYALAKYSRSDQQLKAAIEEISASSAEKFLSTYYFQYGHRSIADLAHLTMAIENVSILAAFYISDEPLWDGQSRSSRYQDFRKNGFYIPAELQDDPVLKQYHDALEYMISRYEYFMEKFQAIIKATHPKPETLSTSAYNRTVRARALDVARYFLPLATLTSIGQITSARVLEQQISRLTAQPFTELQQIGAAMKAACVKPPLTFTESKIKQVLQYVEAHSEDNDALKNYLREQFQDEGAVAPTLVKYTNQDIFEPALLRMAKEALAPHLAGYDAQPDLSSSVQLSAPEDDFLEAYLCSLLFVTDARSRSYVQLQRFAASMQTTDKLSLLEKTMQTRGDHDEWLRVHRIGYTLGFDILADFGALRDLHRHRRATQLIPALKLDLGFDDPSAIISAGLGAEGASLAEHQGLIAEFGEAMHTVMASAQQFPVAEFAPYLLPLGAKQRLLMKMDFAEAGYIIELRSRSSGHFSYRKIAVDMYDQLTSKYPYLEKFIRVTPLSEFDLLER